MLMQIEIAAKAMKITFNSSHRCWQTRVEVIIIYYSISQLSLLHLMAICCFNYQISHGNLCCSQDQTCGFTITRQPLSRYVLRLRCSAQFQLNAVCFAECCKQYIFPKMSKDVCSLAKAHNENCESKNPPVRRWRCAECVQWHAAHWGWKLILT